ncbi:CCA tRNA nucleotidyltransferase, mitochondrial-like [Homalodisca vitripennis]|uniref:CCA tRNA nucleotidyltransferase, mitochondrial-like n=1 Tax=Homalodisca vitripennis TaxID=197043 RepID=UPI001EE9E60C|nr:CCA tRNA nucleotidyltransferase, mitochondrial-like [Homalodisca vitripennis]
MGAGQDYGMPSHDIDVTLDNMSGYAFALGLLRRLAKMLRNSLAAALPRPHPQNPDSRIPTIKPGTPAGDALRRDITVNALFYNLHSGEIEDYTGAGLRDIRDRIIQDASGPQITLQEDPLRIMRIFRFKAKLGFDIDHSIYEALAAPEIESGLRCKVASERIEMELFKMLGYENGYVGWRRLSRRAMSGRSSPRRPT